MSDDLARVMSRVRRVTTQIGSFRELHSQELQMILDELADIAASAEEAAARAPAEAPVDGSPEAGATGTDPAAASPKRAKWRAEQEHRAHLSRRDLLRAAVNRPPGAQTEARSDEVEHPGPSEG